MVLQTLVVLLILIVTTTPSIGHDRRTEAVAHFERGKRLIEENCADCLGRTQEGLQGGIDELLAAQRGGYPNEAVLYRQLADAYGTMAIVFLAADARKQEEMLGKARGAYKKASELAPDNADALAEYLTWANLDRKESISLYRRVLSLDPKHWEAHFSLGILLIEDGRAREGIAEVKTAVLGSDNVKDMENYIWRARDATTAQKCEVGLPGAENRLPPWGDADAFAAYRRNCVAVLESIQCKEPPEDPRPKNAPGAKNGALGGVKQKRGEGRGSKIDP